VVVAVCTAFWRGGGNPCLHFHATEEIQSYRDHRVNAKKPAAFDMLSSLASLAGGGQD